ncbi:MAG: cytochrome bc complex cytochrome b subunit [Candidatus Omnitrophica bacterium]|nr:cytochrome bc complex cytochrome b subunit [Candidatus Omnitrophota bacterium]
MKSPIKRWFAERFDLDALNQPIQKQLKKPLPGHISWFHTLGSMSLFFFVSQVLTGILLLIYYRPTVHDAFESVKYIMTTATMGWLYRQIHAWGANLMIIVVFLHMLRTFITGSYKKPRELTWVFGVLLFFITLVFGFTGYLLPWNQLAYWATTVGTEVAGAVPVVGEPIKILLRGGVAVGGETISRFFVVHVIILPWALFFIILIHIFMVRYQGIATMDPVGSEKKVTAKEGIPFFPDHVLKEGIVFFVLLGVLITLSVLAPFDLGEKADPLKTPHAIKPEWYFLPMYQVLKYFPKLLGIFVVSLAPLFLVIWPFLDRGKERHPLRRPLSMTIGVLVILSLLIFGVLAHFSETRHRFLGKTYEFDIYGIPHPVSESREAGK